MYIMNYVCSVVVWSERHISPQFLLEGAFSSSSSSSSDAKLFTSPEQVERSGQKHVQAEESNITIDGSEIPPNTWYG